MGSSMQVCKHYFVSGKVQGVWFRAETQNTAQSLGVSGWVRNLPDGRVEVMAAGSPQLVEQLEAWLRHGPERARVDELIIEDLPWQLYAGFEIL